MFSRLSKHVLIQGRSTRSLSFDSESPKSEKFHGMAASTDSPAGSRISASLAHMQLTSERNLTIAKNDHSKLGTTVRQILDNPHIAKRFKEYAASLHADEGLRFLDHLQTVIEMADQKAAAAQLVEQYIKDGAEHQVNLQDSLRTHLIATFDEGKYDSVAELFQDATYEIFTDIKKSDTFRNFLQIDEEAKRISSNETLLLDSWLCNNENFRLALQCVSLDENHLDEICNLIRFCASVSEFEKEDDKIARKARGNKISATFIQAGSTFQITLPEMYTDSILAGHYQVLPDARIECLQILAKNGPLMEQVRINLAEKDYSTSLTPPGGSRANSAMSTNSSTTSSKIQELSHILSTSQGIRFAQKLAETTSCDAKILNKARFCSAVACFMMMPGTCDSNNAKLGHARKIVSNYIQVGSNFQIDIAPGFVEDLTKKKSPNYTNLFGVIYQQMISDLVCEECVSECLSDWELNETS
jgi:hypothetical protein